MTAASAPDPQRPFAVVREMTLIILVTLALVTAFKTLLFQPFTIPSGSMEPGLVDGDYIVVSKFDLGWSGASLPFAPRMTTERIGGRAPQRGEVLVFRSPGDRRVDVIKRVIGLPGDRVQVRDGVVLLNDRPLSRTEARPAIDRDGLRVTEARETNASGVAYRVLDRGPGHPGDDTGVYRVPQGQVFVMGDHRDNSLDSRWAPPRGFGFIPTEAIVGRARGVVFNWRPGASPIRPWTWFRFEGDRFARPIR